MFTTTVALDRGAMATMFRQHRLTAQKLARASGVADRTVYRAMSTSVATLRLLDKFAEVVGSDAVAKIILYEEDRTDFLARPVREGSEC